MQDKPLSNGEDYPIGSTVKDNGNLSRFQKLLDSSLDVICSIDEEGKFSYVSSASKLVWGYEPEELIGIPYMELVHPEDHSKTEAIARELISGKNVTSFENRYIKKGGDIVPVLWSARWSEEDKSLYGVAKDLTEKKEALELANERYTLASQASSDVLWDWDLNSQTCYFSPTFTRLFGHQNQEDVIYKNWSDNIHEEDIMRITHSIQEALHDATVINWEEEYKFYRKDRRIAHVLDRRFIIRNDKGIALRMVGSLQDITRQKEITEELQKLSLVAKETVNAVVITDAEEKITWVNKAFTDVTEYSFDEVIGSKPSKLLQGKNTSPVTKAYLKRCIEGKQPFNCEILNYSKWGREYWMEIKGQPIFDEEGEVKQFFAIQTDITHRKEAEAIIRSSEEKYKRLFYGSPQAKWIFNVDTLKIVDVNEAAIRLYGYSRQEFLNLTICDLKVEGTSKQLTTDIEKLSQGKIEYFNKLLQHKKKNGEAFFINVTSFTLSLPTGLHFISSGTDMTEKIQLEQELIAEKIEAQKEVSKAIISTQEKERSEIGKELHDNVCQLLTTSKLYFENIKYFSDRKDEFADRGIEILQKSINEIRFLSKQLVTPVLNDVGFKATIEELIIHYQSLNVFEINLQYNLDEDLIDKDLKLAIYRILQELFNNTVKYAKATQIEFHLRNNSSNVEVFYRDNGVGFDPTSSKAGIGLKNIQNRADAYKGLVKIDSSAGKGCEVQILFPV